MTPADRLAALTAADPDGRGHLRQYMLGALAAAVTDEQWESAFINARRASSWEQVA